MDIKQVPILHAPYYKGKNFCPNPIAKYGIPKYADSISNPKVINTPDYLKYWEEQLYYIHNGYQTGGIFIPGRYYYFLNFSTFATVGGVVTPDVCDLHLELAYLIDYAKANGKNVISAKGRRKGISEFTQKAVIDYGYRFNYSYQAGIAAGLKDYAEDFMKKWDMANNSIIPELRIGTLINNDDEVVAGYKIKEGGAFITKGTDSKIFVRTMHSNPNMFKGLYLNDVVAEECGEFENLKEFYTATKACLFKGSQQIGTMFFYGTGGNITKGSKDFMEIWQNPDQFNFIKFLIPATRFYFPHYGGATDNNKDVSVVPNLLNSEYKPYQLIGVEDEEKAKQSILEQREIKKKGPLKDYLEDLQNFPLDEHEIFRKMFSNNFDIEKLNNQSDEIVKNRKKYSKWKLEWVLNENGIRKDPLQVKAVPAKDHDDENECILILDEFHPDKKYQHLYVGGIDPYDQDKGVSKSLGAMCVTIRKNTVMPQHSYMPVAIICTRPKRKEIFFDMCLKLSVYYGLVGVTLGDKAGSSGIINWFKDNGCQRYLAPRPTKFESVNSQQANEYWFSINSYSRPMMISLMQTGIYDYCQNIWFPQLIDQLGNFDEVEIGSDNDLADAWGISLVQDASLTVPVRDVTENDKEDPFSLGGWAMDKSGDWVPVKDFERPSSPEQDYEGFGL
jgi:hypothetical protein